LESVATILISSRNARKIGEIKSILGGGFHWLTLNDFSGAPEVVEDAPTFAGNATKKAIELAKWVAGTCSSHVQPDLSVLADDSGLEVDALNGAPGVHSARFADPGGRRNSSDQANTRKLLALLKDIPLERRTARFRCVIALTPVLSFPEKRGSPVCDADEFEVATQIAEGVCEGRIGFEPKGEGGFGYDPLFIPAGFSQTFAELGEAVKNGLSHRGKALAALKRLF
jgi:XTP/dITP diphosphohydrolase